MIGIRELDITWPCLALSSSALSFGKDSDILQRCHQNALYDYLKMYHLPPRLLNSVLKITRMPSHSCYVLQ